MCFFICAEMSYCSLAYSVKDEPVENGGIRTIFGCMGKYPNYDEIHPQIAVN